MTTLGVVGGKLQGMEAAYLAKKAGMKVVVLDRDPKAPALALADEGVVIDTTMERKRTIDLLTDCDAVLPANENLDTLVGLTNMLSCTDVPLIFDIDAYLLSSSKIRSNQFMKRLGIPQPRTWPECGYPVVVKPSGGSGSDGVTRATDHRTMVSGVEKIEGRGDEVVIEEFLDGPSVSIEVIGDGTNFIPLVTTEVFLDDAYDCKMVGSPWEARDGGAEPVLIDASRTMAQALGLRGIMDVEAIVVNGVPRVLEIDARIPSQTPTAVFHSHGINMVDMLVKMSLGEALEKPSRDGAKAAFYEHISVDDGIMRSCGEGRFAEVSRPRIVPGLFGSDEMITDYEPGKKSWRATIITSADDARAAREKRAKVIQDIINNEGISQYTDPQPEGYE
ncbi:MAG: 3-methylornithine--L-lysine ligase PylC [Methanomassiliicoccus sp.]|nr:3-methylornithine--L-lysine ligase PylC [Methanomassiliicoccus sp.]